MRPGAGDRRQHRDRLDLQQRALARQARDRDGRARRPVMVGEIAVAHLAEDRQVLHVDEVIVELHDVVELGPDRGQRVLQVLECLHRLQAEIAAELAVTVDPELPGDVDEPRRRRGLDHMGVAGRLLQRLGIDETDIAQASSSCRSWRDHAAIYAKVCSATARLASVWRRNFCGGPEELSRHAEANPWSRAADFPMKLAACSIAPRSRGVYVLKLRSCLKS